MQKYQVFIDEHLVSIGEGEESNQQFDSFFSIFNSDEIDFSVLISWLLSETEANFNISLLTQNTDFLWKRLVDELTYLEAAGGLVKNEKGELLMIYRLDKWDLPKGKLEKNEKPEEAALREVEEECGISNIELGEELTSTYHIYQHKGKTILKRTYWYKMSYSGNEVLIPQAEEAIEKAIWKTPNEVTNAAENTYASLKALILGGLTS